MKRWAYRIGSLLAGSAAFVALDIHVGYLRLMAGALLILASLGLWDAGGKRS
jgi:ethanolamine utilization microcompartment shell protein EutS